MGSNAYKPVGTAGILLAGVLEDCEPSLFERHVVLDNTASPSLLGPGWYRIQLSGPWQERNVVVHVDYGDGLWEADRIALERMTVSATGVLSGVLLLSVAATRIRIGWQSGEIPRPIVIGLHRASLARVSFLLLMRELRARPLHALPGMISILHRRGRRGLGDWLYGRYAGTGFEPMESHLELAESPVRYSAAVPRTDAAPGQPLFSVLVPCYNSDLSFLRACLQSVLSQTCADWELCIVDDCSTDMQVNETIRAYALKDARIKFVARESNGHISVATNTALSLATGIYIVLLDHDDELHPMAIAELAATVALRPELDLVFTNEDKIDVRGRRRSPFLKTGYNPELLRAQNCVSHVAAYKRAIVQRLGGFREGYEGSQDWDLALRVADHSGADRVGHIPKIMYHWRTTNTSTAVSAEAKPYALDSAIRAVEDALGRKGSRDACVKPLLRLPGSLRVVFPIAGRGVRVSLIALTGGRLSPIFRQQCLDAACASRISLEFLEAVAAEEPARMGNEAAIIGEPIRGQGQAKNIAASRAQAEVLVFLDATVEGISSGWLEEIVSQAAREDVGAVGGKLYGRDGRIRNGGYVVDREGAIHAPHRGMTGQHLGHANRARLAQNVSGVPSCCMAVRRSVFEMLGGFDETLAEPYCSVDFCLRANAAGLSTVWTPYAEFVDHCGDDLGGLSVPCGVPRWDGGVDRLVERDTARRRRWQEASRPVSSGELRFT
jgi:glycosyltransferase involved in cell wall biosynthesis